MCQCSIQGGSAILFARRHKGRWWRGFHRIFDAIPPPGCPVSAYHSGANRYSIKNRGIDAQHSQRAFLQCSVGTPGGKDLPQDGPPVACATTLFLPWNRSDLRKTTEGSRASSTAILLC